VVGAITTDQSHSCASLCKNADELSVSIIDHVEPVFRKPASTHSSRGS
jgi:hypothetical protein